MRKFKTILMVALAVTFLLVPSIGSFAAEAEDSYRITISAGNHGKIGDSDKISVDVPLGGTFSFIKDTVTLNTDIVTDAEGNTTEVPSKYYVKGIRLSGRDDAPVYTRLSLVAKEDADYVVVYGITGNQTLYTVEYVDANGKKLAETDKFYGNIGDKPIVAGKYIAGYAPQAFALTATLVENPTGSSEINNFKFVYTPSQIDYFNKVTEIVDGGTYVVYVDGPTVVVNGGTTGGGGGATGGDAGGGATNVTGEADETANPDDENAGGAAGGDEMPPEIIDLDDEETPLANIEADSDDAGNMAPMALYVGMGLLALIAIIVAVYLTKKLKKKEEA